MAKEITYIGPDDLVEIVDTIRSFDYENYEEIPHYDDDRHGIDEYFALIERLKSDTFYPDVIAKATALFLYLNTGHYFSNGNKRIAVFSLLAFLDINEYTHKEYSKEDVKVVCKDLFGTQNLEDFNIFSELDFAMYNFAIITAQFNKNNVDFETAKKKVTTFLNALFEPKS